VKERIFFWIFPRKSAGIPWIWYTSICNYRQRNERTRINKKEWTRSSVVEWD
jgi:hypothetical protein